MPEALKDNRVALRPIVPGEPVLASNVSGADGRARLEPASTVVVERDNCKEHRNDPYPRARTELRDRLRIARRLRRHAIGAERETGGEVRCEELRPDIDFEFFQQRQKREAEPA